MKKILSFSFLSFLIIAGKAQIAAWNFNGQNSPATFAATTFDAHLVSSSGGSNITRGSGAASSAGSNSFRTQGFKNTGISTSNAAYFQITLTAAAGYALSLSTIDAQLTGTQTFVGTDGVSNQFAYSLDGTNFTLIGSPQVLTGTVPLTLAQIDLTGITALQNVAAGTTVTIRFYASGQTTSGGWGFYSSNATSARNGLSIGGAVNVAVTPGVATQLGFANVPATGIPNVNLSPFTVNVLKADGTSIDAAYATAVTIAKASGPGSLTGTTTQTPVNGAVTFSDLKFDAAGAYTLTASSGALTPATTGNIIITDGTVATDYFRTQTSGNWADVGTWQSSHDSSTWMNATATPDNHAAAIVVQSGHTVTVASNVTVGQVTINGNVTIATATTLTINRGSTSKALIIANGGTLLNQGSFSLGTSAAWQIQNGGTFIHNTSSGVSTPLNAVTLDAGSNFIYRGSSAISITPSISNRTYSNLAIESASGTFTPSSVSGGTPFTVNGKLTIGANVVWNITSWTGILNLKNDVDIKGKFTPNSFSVAAGKTLSIYPGGTLIVPSGKTVDVSNGSFIILSDATGTGSIGNSAGIITGNATVQRYVGSSSNNPLYPWRMIGFPVSGSINASDLSSQYGAGYNAYTFAEGQDDGTNYGATGAMNNGWVQFTGGTTAATNGILIIGGTPSSTLNVTGVLNTGLQNIGLAKTKNGWNFIANPYASDITWSSIYANNSSLVDAAVYRYNPYTTGYDSYVAGSSGTGGLTEGILENGAGFFVEAAAAGNLQIAETDKTSSAPAISLFGGGSSPSSPASIVRLNLKQNGDAYGSEAVILWGSGVSATDEFDSKYDAYNLGRAKGANLAVMDDKGTAYSIFHGSNLKSADIENREIALKVSQLSEGAYTLDATIESPIINGNQLFIYDHYAGQYALIDGSNKTYSFTVTGIAASQAANRFSLVMNAKTAEEADNSSAATISLVNNPVNNNSFILFSQANFNTVQWQLIDGSGNSLGSGKLHNLQKSGVYKVSTPVIANGIYFIKLTGDNKKLNTLKLIKQ